MEQESFVVVVGDDCSIDFVRQDPGRRGVFQIDLEEVIQASKTGRGEVIFKTSWQAKVHQRKGGTFFLLRELHGTSRNDVLFKSSEYVKNKIFPSPDKVREAYEKLQEELKGNKWRRVRSRDERPVLL